VVRSSFVFSGNALPVCLMSCLMSVVRIDCLITVLEQGLWMRRKRHLWPIVCGSEFTNSSARSRMLQSSFSCGFSDVSVQCGVC
jgi:hypothetical protein